MYRPSGTHHAPKPAVAEAPGRAQRALAAVAKTIGLGLVFSLATAGGALVHLGLPAPRRFVAARVNDLLEGTFKGKIVVHRVGSLHLNRLTGVDAEVFDPEGNRVLFVQGARARFGTLTLLRTLVSGNRLVLNIPELSIDGAEVVLEENAAGELGLQRAFESREADTGEPSRGTEVTIGDIQLRHAWVHGHMAAVPVLDADLKYFTGAFQSTPDTTGIDVGHLIVRGRGLEGMNPEGTVEGRLSLPSDPNDPVQVSAHYEGQVGQIPVLANGSLIGKKVMAVLDVPETMPEAIEGLAPGQIKLGAAVSAHAEVHGELPVLEPQLHAWIGGSEITASGTVTLPEAPHTELLASARLGVKDLDLSLLQADAPVSRLTAVVSATVVSRPGGELEGSFHLDNEVGEVAGQIVPAATAEGDFTERSVYGSAQIAERCAPTSVGFSLQPRGDSSSPTELDFEVETTIPSLAAIQRLGPIGRGSAHIVVKGGIDLETRRATATAEGELSGIDVQGVRLSRGFVTGGVEGSLDALESPRFNASVRGAGMSAAGYQFTSVRASASGTPQELEVAARLMGDGKSPHVAARAHLSNREALTVSSARVRVEREDVATNAQVASIRVAGGTVDIRGMTARGLGDPIEAQARISAGGMMVKAKGAGLDLSRLAKLLAREEDVRGHLAFDVDLTTRGRGANGHVNASIDDLALRGIEGATVKIDSSLEGQHLSGNVLAALGKAGRIYVSAPQIELGGPVMEATAWTTATGAASISGALDLDLLLAQVPEEWRPVGAASGTVSIRGGASRATKSGLPSLDLEASTMGLTVVAKQEKHRNEDGSVTLGPTPMRTSGVDGEFGFKLDGTTSHTQVLAKLHDRHGPLVWLDASAKLPIDELVANPGRGLALVADTEVVAKVAVPRRSLDAMPAALGPMPVKGEVELAAEFRGTTRAPKLTLSAKGTSLLPRRAAECVRPVDLDTSVVYDGQKADVRLAAARDGREVMAADAAVQLDAAQVMGGGAVAWQASGNVALKSFPLDAAAGFLEQPVGGTVSGKIAVKDLHRAATLEADLDLQDLVLDQSTFPRGKVHVDMKDGTLGASVRLDQVDGYVETTAKGAMSWGAELAPDVDLAKAIDVTIRADNFRANAALPFVQGTLTDLDGRIDADAKVHIEPGAKDGRMSGAVTLREGVIEVPQLGERFHSMQGRVVMSPWGTLRFEDFTAEASTGKLTASGTAQFQGLALRSADAKIQIAQGQSIPITVEGVPMGRAYGDITTHAQMTADGKRLDIDVDIPVLHVDLPQSTGHAVQPLEPDETVRIGVHAGKDFAILPLVKPEEARAASDLAIRARVKLGRDVEIKRDTTVHVVANGETTIDIGEQTRVTGQIRLDRGKLEIQGKQFIVDRGTVTFVGDDPSEPMIIATAYWDAPDSTRVFVDFSGRPSSGKLNLRAEPSLTQDEILSLILFGSRDGSFGAAANPGQEASTGTKAAGMAGGVVTQGVNKAISGITTADITTRVDTSDSNNPRPELAVQLSRSVSARLSYNLGVPAPGDNPDRTELTLEWRFIRNWSLVTVVGDQGSTSLDLVWRLRY